MKQLKRLPEFIRFVMVGVFATALHYGIYFLLQKFINVNIARSQLYRQFLPYRLLYVRQKAVMEQSVRFRRGAFIQLPVAHRTAEHLPVAGTFQSHRSYSGIRHSHSGQFLIGALRFQTKRLMYSNRCFFK